MYETDYPAIRMGTSSQSQPSGEAGLFWSPDRDSAAGGDGPVGSLVDRRGP